MVSTILGTGGNGNRNPNSFWIIGGIGVITQELFTAWCTMVTPGSA